MPRKFHPLIVATMLAALSFVAEAAANGELDLGDAWQRVRNAHPDLAATTAEVLAREADADQAARGLNPELELELENFAGGGEFAGLGGADLTLQLAQTWQRGGKTAHRRRAADLATEAAQLEHTHRRLELRADLVRRFVDVLSARLRADLADTLVAIAEQDREAVARRVAVGAESRLEAQRAHVALADASRERDRAGDALRLARIRLGSLWGDARADFPPVVGSLHDLLPVPEWADVLDASVGSPVRRRAALERRRAEVMVDVVRSQGASDVVTAAGVRRFGATDDLALVASLSIPLAVRDRNRDAVRAAAQDLAARDAESRSAAATLNADLADAWHRLATSRDDLVALRGDILPAAAGTMKQALADYTRGRFSLTDVLAVRRSWLDWQLRHTDAMARHHKSAADLAALLGTAADEPANHGEDGS